MQKSKDLLAAYKEPLISNNNNNKNNRKPKLQPKTQHKGSWAPGWIFNPLKSTTSRSGFWLERHGTLRLSMRISEWWAWKSWISRFPGSIWSWGIINNTCPCLKMIQRFLLHKTTYFLHGQPPLPLPASRPITNNYAWEVRNVLR